MGYLILSSLTSFLQLEQKHTYARTWTFYHPCESSGTPFWRHRILSRMTKDVTLKVGDGPNPWRDSLSLVGTLTLTCQ